MLIADYSLGDALLTVLEIFLLVAWFWILITIIGDLFRDHEISGWGKAAWVLFLIFVPFLGPLIYLIARGEGMRERAVKEQADMQEADGRLHARDRRQLAGRRAAQAQRAEGQGRDLGRRVRSGEGQAARVSPACRRGMPRA